MCPCLGLGLFMSYLCDLFPIFSLIFIVIGDITSLKQSNFFFYILRISLIYLFWMTTWMKKMNNFQIAKVQLQGVAWLVTYKSVPCKIRV